MFNIFSQNKIPTILVSFFFCLTLGIFAWVYKIEQQRFYDELQTLNNQTANAIQTEVNIMLTLMQGLGGLFVSSEHVTKEEYLRFFKQTFPEHNDIIQANWILHADEVHPIISNSEYYQDIQQNYEVKTFDDKGQLLKTESQDVYYPVMYSYSRPSITPYDEGLDLGSSAQFLEMLNKLKNLKIVSAITLFEHYRSSSDKTISVYMPVYKKEKEQQYLLGLVSLEFSFPVMIDEALNRFFMEQSNRGLRIYAKNNDNAPQLILSHPKNNKSFSKENERIPNQPESELNIANHQFILSIYQGDNRFNPASTIVPWLILLAGLMVTTFTAIYFYLLDKKQREEHMYKQRQLLSEERFRELFDNMASGVAVYKAVENGNDFVFVDFNKTAQKFDHVNRNEILGKKVTEIFPGVIEFGLLDVFRKVYQSGKGVRHPVSFYQDERVTAWRENFVYQLSSGEIVAIYDDLTQVKQAEQAIKVANQQFSSVLEGIDAIIYVADIENHEILYLNDKAKQVFGDVKHKKCWEVLQAEFGHECKNCVIPKLFDKNGMPAGVYRWEFHNQTENRWFLCHDIAIPWSDRAYARMQIATDISSQKQAEQDLRDSNLLLEQEKQRANQLAAKAEAANQAKGYFLANMSHEIRTPMNGMLGVCQLLKDTELDQEQVELIATMVLSGNSLLRIIDDILDYSKIESGKIILEEVVFDLPSTVENIINLLTPNIAGKTLVIENKINNFDSQLIGDQVRFTQVIINLLGNAIKFTDNGKISLAVEILEESEQSLSFRFVISDTGIGIEADKLNHIFDNFTQADATTTRQYGGTGLGLSISKKLIHLMGGDINVESQPGQGSTFSFNLKLKKAPILVSSQEQSKHLPKVDTSHKILLVEDDRVNQMVATKMLHKLGYQVETANNGLEAIEQIKRHDFDLVFMDMQMPVMDGIEATRQIRNDNPDLTIVAMTANAMEQDKEKCLNAGMNDYVTKPVKIEIIRSVLDNWLG